jgi:hypothetical protein
LDWASSALENVANTTQPSTADNSFFMRRFYPAALG